jgi:hypothetical protein
MLKVVLTCQFEADKPKAAPGGEGSSGGSASSKKEGKQAKNAGRRKKDKVSQSRAPPTLGFFV